MTRPKSGNTFQINISDGGKKKWLKKKKWRWRNYSMCLGSAPLDGRKCRSWRGCDVMWSVKWTDRCISVPTSVLACSAISLLVRGGTLMVVVCHRSWRATWFTEWVGREDKWWEESKIHYCIKELLGLVVQFRYINLFPRQRESNL